MKRDFVLVLSGGGAKGIYQIGAWKALIEEKIDIKGVFGTSIGSINGAFIIQNDFNLALDFWMGLTVDSVFNIPEELIKDGKIEISLENINVLLKFQKEIAKNGGIDNTPLKQRLMKYIDSTKIFKSKKDFGLVTYSISSLSPIELFKENMVKENFYNYLLASSSLPGLKPVKIGDEITIDGGVYDNIPYDLAKKRGYKNIIIVDVKGIGINRDPEIENTNTIYIKTIFDLGSILEIDKKLYERNFKLGYNETKKIFNHYYGYRYTFRNYKKYDEVNSYLEKNSSLIFSELHIKKQNIVDILPEKYKYFTDYLIVLIENCMDIFDMDVENVYDYKKVIETIKEKYFEKRKSKYTLNRGITKFFDFIDEKQILAKVMFYLFENKIL